MITFTFFKPSNLFKFQNFEFISLFCNQLDFWWIFNLKTQDFIHKKKSEYENYYSHEHLSRKKSEF